MCVCVCVCVCVWPGYQKLEHYATLAVPGGGGGGGGAPVTPSSSGAGSIRIDPMYSKIELIPPYKTSLHGPTAQVRSPPVAPLAATTRTTPHPPPQNKIIN